MDKVYDGNFDTDDEMFFDANESVNPVQENNIQENHNNISEQADKLSKCDLNDNVLSEALEENQEESKSAPTEESLTEEEKEDLRQEAIKLKDDGNQEFKLQRYTEAGQLYSQGLKICPKCFAKERAVLFSNRAASLMSMDKKKEAILDCNDALELDPNYVKALLRRAQLYEDTEKLDESLEDYKKIIEIDPSVFKARQACKRLPEQINERNEKLKEEMMGNLKQLGNTILGKFGLSTDNFQMEKNSDTGSYNIQFKQNPGNS
ncbi:tetratricopeptide repeat protein 1-like [Clavelina lepadiformis]|uniref:Tetratricopeptide repeat protein 1 n=1 Tax=Clavelina lepadiformis TaxID=159417 RepID=A0ABP0F7E0_CLALP